MTNEDFIILKSLLEKLIDILSSNNPYMPLFLVLIGAVSAIIPQSIYLLLQSRKEKKEKIRGLLADTYKYSQLLKDYYKELVMHKVHKNYWHQSSINVHDQKLGDLYYSWSNESSKKSFDTELRIRNTYSEFVKIVRSFEIYTGRIEVIDSILKDISSYKPRKVKQFNDIADENLRDAANKEEEELQKEYEKYSEFYDSIILVMRNKIKLK
jgi:hypothetical protein